MRTIQMTLDDDLVTAVDRVSKELRTSRSAFTRKALREALARYSLEQQEQKHQVCKQLRANKLYKGCPGCQERTQGNQRTPP